MCTSMRIVLIFVALACVAAPALGHSWLGCSDYRGDVSVYDQSKCYGWPRNFKQFFANTPVTADGYQLGADMGYNYNGADSCNQPRTNPISNSYSTQFPMAKYEQGKTYDVNPSADPDQATFKLRPVESNYGTHQNQQIDCLGFQRSPKFCSNTGFALATGCITLPADLPVGQYVFQWYWAFNNAADVYKTCFDVEVVAPGAGTGGGGLTGWETVVDNLSPAGDTCRKAWAAAGNPPAPGANAPVVYPTNNAGAGACDTSLNGTMSDKIKWLGTFDSYEENTDLDAWSFSNPVGEYQTYIHGGSPGLMSTYVELDDDYLNLADHDFAKQGIALSTDGTSNWNGGTMLRTELVARIDNNAIMTGIRFFHFSMKEDSAAPLKQDYEHQLVFFENHQCEIKYGINTNNLQFWAGGSMRWSTTFGSTVWHSFALEVNFDANTCALWHGTAGSTSITKQTVDYPVSGDPSDFHVGKLRLPKAGAQDPAKETVWYSSIFISEDAATTPVLVGTGPNCGTPDKDLDGSARSTASASFALIVAMTAALRAML